MGITIHKCLYICYSVSLQFSSCFQDEIEATCPDLLRLGLLSEIGIDAATVRDQSPCVSFHHKSLQDYSASMHVVETLEESKNMKVMSENRIYILNHHWKR